MGLFDRKTIFDVLKEAEDDETTANDTTETGEDEAPAPENSGEDMNAGDNTEDGADEDFNIDTELDDESAEDNTTNGEEPEDTSSSSSSDSGSSEEDKEIPANTDIFASLTPEEQQIKIIELKKLFNTLYSSTSDILERINQTNTDETNIDVVTKVSSTLYCLRQYMCDYITHTFPNKSYIENDIAFNRFLSIINGISTIIEEIGAIRMAKLGKK